MLPNELENRQILAGLRYSTPTPRYNGTKYQPQDPFTIPQTPKIRSRPVSPENGLANVSISPLSPTNVKPTIRDRRLPRSLRRATSPYSRVSSPPYNFRISSDPLPMRGSYGLDTPKDPALRAKSMRHSRSSRSRSPMGRYNVNYDPPLSQISPSFQWPISPVSLVNYRHGYGGTVDTFSSNSVFRSPGPRHHPRPSLQDLSPLFYSPSPNDKSSLKPGFEIRGYQTKILVPTPRPTPPFEDSPSLIAPKPVSQLTPAILLEEAPGVEPQHTPDTRPIPSTTTPVIPKHDLDPQTSSTSVPDGHHRIPQVGEPERFTRLKDYVKFFVADTIPRQLYLLFLFRLPALYFMRVVRIFEESDLTLEEIEEMAASSRDDEEGSNTKYDRLKKAWELLITRLVREWETFNVVSVLLLPAIVSMFQIQGATDDPVTRYMAFWSLICALLSSLYDCLFIICFPTMRKPHKAAAWAFEALKTQKIFWNVWVMLAMPAVWICWSILTFIVCIMSFMWRAKAELPPDYQFTVARSTEVGMRIFICVVLGLGVAYGFLIFTTLSRFGSGMDKAWRLQAEAFYAPPMPHTAATPLPPEYRATEQSVAEGTSTTRPTEPGQANRDQNTVNTRDPASDTSKLPPAYQTPLTPTTYSKHKLSSKSPSPSSSPTLATHRSSRQHKSSHSGKTHTLGGPPPPRSISPPRRYSRGRSSDDLKVSDEDRGRSTIAHSRSRAHLQNHADSYVGTSQNSPEVRIIRPDNEKGHTIPRDSFLLGFSGNDGDILLEEIRDKNPGQAKSS